MPILPVLPLPLGTEMANRRSFLQRALTLPLLSAVGLQAGKLFAAPATQNRFLLVFLRGGYDAANLLIPYSSPFYYESRPSIAIAQAGSR